ncbi:MAG TPA: CehA/McbA family metallohydrolase [Oscillatoriaceae cyanobacterium]
MEKKPMMKFRSAPVLITAIALVLAGCGQSTLGPALLASSSQMTDQASPLLDSPNATGPLNHMPAPATRPGQWLLFANHEHTKFSVDGSGTVSDMVNILQKGGVDAMDLTDHNNMQGVLTPDFANSPLIMIKGMEWGAWRQDGETVVGHAGLLEMDGTDPLPTNATLDEMLAMASARHAYIIANHPFCNGNAWASAPVLQPQVSAMEVWNGYWTLTEPITHNDKALAWYDSLLQGGRHLTAIGGADYHGPWYQHLPSVPGSEPMRPVNLVFATSHDAKGVMDGVRGGHITVEATNTAARVVLEADPAHDGSWATIEGDDIPVASNGTIPMRAHVIGGKGLTVTFFGKSGPIGAAKVTSDDQEVPVTVPAVPGIANYVRVELQQHPGHSWSMTALTNPIYLN